MIRIRAAALTDIGRVRRRNEDRMIADEELGLFGVADVPSTENRGELDPVPKQGEAEEIEIENVEEYLYLGEVKDMNAAILDGAENYLSAEETRNHVRTALALYRSVAENRIVLLDD